MTDSAQLRGLVTGFQVTEALHVAVVLGLPDLVEDGPRGIDDLAAASASDPASLYRLMRALAAAGVFEELPDRRFAATGLSTLLTVDAPGSLRPWVLNVSLPAFRQAWAGLLDSIVTGRNAFSTVHGTTVWAHRAAHPDEGEIFDGAMTALSQEVATAVTAAYDFGRFETVVDVAGGRGALLAAILNQNPGQRGILFDQPHVVEGAGTLLEARGVADRCSTVGGSFFDVVPSGGDAYLLKSIVHDWDDEHCVLLLVKVREAMGPSGVLFIVERVLEGANEGLSGKLSDLNMLVAPGGLERTEAEFDALLAQAGLRRTQTVSTASTHSLLVVENA